MNRNDFTDNLRSSLNGKIAPAQVEEHIRYYNDYINTQLRMGRTEEDVMVELGDPRLIAKTIVHTSTGDATRSYRETEGYEGYEGTGGSYDEYEDSYAPTSTGMKFLQWFVGWPRWVKTALALTVGMGAVWIVLNVLTFLSPVLIPLCIIGLIVKLARDGL